MPGERRGTPRSRGIRRRAARFAGLAALALLAALILAPAARAHAVFVSANPAPDSALAAPPAALRISFSEPLVGGLSSVSVRTASGVRIAPRSAGVDPRNASAYTLQLPRLRPDRYTVIWHTTSKIDGHSRWGSYTFTVLEPDGTAPPAASGVGGPPGAPPQVPTQVQAVTSWAGLAAVFLVVGTVLILLLGGTARAATRRVFGRFLAAAWAGTLVGVLGQFAATWAGVGWAFGALGGVLGDGIAGWLWLRLGAVTVALLAWRVGPIGRVRGAVLTLAASAAVLSVGATGHGAASARPVAGAAFLCVHVLAASVWLGGVLCLATTWALARRHGIGAPERRVLLHRYSLVAGAAVPALAASGAASALLELGSVTDLVRSEYGVTLLIKIALAAAVGAVAVGNAVAHRRGAATAPLRSGRFRAALWAEAGLGLLVLVPTATMSVLGPSGPADAARAAGRRLQAQSDPAAAFTGSASLGGHGLELSLTPGTTGPNAVTAEVDGTYGAARLHVRLAGPAGDVTAPLRRTGYDHDPQTHTIYQGTLTAGSAGNWSAVVTGPGTASAVIVVPLRAPTAPSSSLPVSLPASPPRLDSWLLAIAVLGAAGVVLAVARCPTPRCWRRTSLALGSAAAVAALTAVTGLAIVVPRASPALAAAPWGTTRRVSPVSAHGATTWPVGPGSAGLMMPAVAPDGSVWVGEMDQNALARLQPADGSVQELPLPGGYKEVMGVAVDGDGHVWVAEEHAQAVGMFDPATGRYREYPVPGHDPAPLGVAVDPSGTVWVTLMNGNAIGRLDPATGHVTEYPVPSAHALPYWLALGRGGQVYFTEFGTGRIGRLDPASGRIREYPLPRGSTPAGIATAASGTVWASTTEGTLARFDPRTGELRIIRMPAADAYGVAVGPRGLVWIGVASGGATYSYDPATGAFARHRLPAHSDPWWVAAGEAHVWVALSSPNQGGLGELEPVS